MSWDAELSQVDVVIAEWNYTSNISRMLVRCVDGAMPWYSVLDGKTGERGTIVLSRIIENLESDPEGFRAMNPANGWGDYDSLLEVLRDMRDWSAASPLATWSVSS